MRRYGEVEAERHRRRIDDTRFTSIGCFLKLLNQVQLRPEHGDLGVLCIEKGVLVFLVLFGHFFSAALHCHIVEKLGVVCRERVASVCDGSEFPE